MDFFDRWRYLNLNSALIAEHFQYRYEVFLKVIFLDGPWGSVKYHSIGVEFEIWRSTHIHSFLWVLDALILAKDNVGE